LASTTKFEEKRKKSINDIGLIIRYNIVAFTKTSSIHTTAAFVHMVSNRSTLMSRPLTVM